MQFDKFREHEDSLVSKIMALADDHFNSSYRDDFRSDVENLINDALADFDEENTKHVKKTLQEVREKFLLFEDEVQKLVSDLD